MIVIYSSNGNTHNLDYDEFDKIRIAIAQHYGQEFCDAYKEYVNVMHNFNINTISSALDKLKEASIKASISNQHLLEFLTSNANYEVDSDTCHDISVALEHSVIGNAPVSNLPTWSKFFGKAYTKKLTITFEDTHIIKGKEEY